MLMNMTNITPVVDARLPHFVLCACRTNRAHGILRAPNGGQPQAGSQGQQEQSRMSYHGRPQQGCAISSLKDKDASLIASNVSNFESKI